MCGRALNFRANRHLYEVESTGMYQCVLRTDAMCSYKLLETKQLPPNCEGRCYEWLAGSMAIIRV